MTIAPDETTATQAGPDLGALFAQFDEYMSFSQEEWALAAAARHRSALERIEELCNLRPAELRDQRLLEGRVKQISELSISVDVDLDLDIAWITARRAETRGAAREDAGGDAPQPAAF